MIDFDRLVLGPAMHAFARPIAILPKGPHRKPYLARGDFREPSHDIEMEDGSLATASPTLGIRASEFDVLPVQDDNVYVFIELDTASPAGFRVLPGVTRRFKITDPRPDGEGDVKLVLKEISSAR